MPNFSRNEVQQYVRESYIRKAFIKPCPFIPIGHRPFWIAFTSYLYISIRHGLLRTCPFYKWGQVRILVNIQYKDKLNLDKEYSRAYSNYTIIMTLHKRQTSRKKHVPTSPHIFSKSAGRNKMSRTTLFPKHFIQITETCISTKRSHQSPHEGCTGTAA